MTKEVMKCAFEKFQHFAVSGGLIHSTEREKRLAREWFIEGYAHGVEAAQMPPPPHECKTDAEKIAYAFGWNKCMELHNRMKEKSNG